MQPKHVRLTKRSPAMRWFAVLLATAVAAVAAGKATAGIISIEAPSFRTHTGLIEFSEPGFGTGQTNPAFQPSDYGGDGGSPAVSFGGFFRGQHLSQATTANCDRAAAGTCVAGVPDTGEDGLALDPDAPDVKIFRDHARDSLVLSGKPGIYGSGPIAAVFSNDQVGIGLDVGAFDASGTLAVTAFARDGSTLGTILNTTTGIEFLGFADEAGDATIAGISLHLVDKDIFGYTLDNLRFGNLHQASAARQIPSPSTISLVALAFAGLGAAAHQRSRRRRSACVTR